MLVYGGLDAGNLLMGVIRAGRGGAGDATLGTARNIALAVSCVLMTSAIGVGFAVSGLRCAGAAGIDCDRCCRIPGYLS